MKEMFVSSRHARAHGRCVVPVVFVKGRCVCRSSTISIGAETLLNAGSSALLSLVWGSNTPKAETVSQSSDNSMSKLWPEYYRTADVSLLKHLNVENICDLMVEGNKKLYGISICSSEKIDATGAYSEFSVNSMPYPGCEFFKDYRNNLNCIFTIVLNVLILASELIYDWSLPFVDASLSLVNNTENILSNIDWSNWKKWSLVTLTQNYMLHILNSLCSSKY